MQISGKWYAVSVLIIVIIAIFAVLAALNVAGIGKALSGFGGPLATGLYNLLTIPFKWVLSGGWPTMAVGVCVIVGLMVAAGYLFEVKQVIGTIKGTKDTTTTMQNYQAQREPEEPETIPTKAT